MKIHYDRIKRAQELMRQHDMVGVMIMNYDDYRYFFGTRRAQPRAIIPAQGPPVIITFAAEEPELRAAIGDAEVKIFTHVGEQINDVATTFRQIMQASGGPPPGAKPRIGMQMWFDTPAFLVDLFRSVHAKAELVPSDPVMDPLRSVKEPEELDFMREAQRIAGLGMDRARELLTPGVTAHEIATEVLYTMMKNGAERTSTPLYVNVGTDTCWIHGRISPTPVKDGDLVVIDLTPQVEGYCANLARTFVVGEPNDTQKRLLTAYAEMREETRLMMKPGVKVKDLDLKGKEICTLHGLGEHHIDGISHGIGLRFEETPASTIIKAHRNVPIPEGATLTVGHTILAMPGVGGVRHEDIFHITSQGAEMLQPYRIEPVVIA